MRQKFPAEATVQISSLTAEGLGVAILGERPLHVRNALPGETVTARILRRKKGTLFADGVAIEDANPDRTASACAYFPRCGGCNMHHLKADAQLVLKQQQLSTALDENNVEVGHWMPPQSAGRLGYRRKARLGVRQVGDQVLVGFRESFSNRVARIDECMVLTPELSRLLRPLKELIGKLSIADKIPQVEMAQGDFLCALMVRHLAPFTAADLALWQQLEDSFGVSVLLQSGGYDTLQTLSGSPAASLGYQIPEHGLYMRFQPDQFTQVNMRMNTVLIRQALSFLGDLNGKRVVDLFCGIGNFSLPLARAGAQVWGYEAVDDAVRMARQNTQLNGLETRASFDVLDLYGEQAESQSGLPMAVDAIVMDPPRSGAGPNLEAWLTSFAGHEIVYVSCNPASFAIDAARLSNAGFDLQTVGIFDMFPHTAHVETMGYFRRAGIVRG
jgi:23S rRNA (uracil1939-C5)-methyltransferase